MKRMNFASNPVKVVVSSLLLQLGWYTGAAQAFSLSYFNVNGWESCPSADCNAALTQKGGGTTR